MRHDCGQKLLVRCAGVRYALSVRGEPGEVLFLEEGFYRVVIRARMAEISAVLAAASLSLLALLFFSCLPVFCDALVEQG